MYQSKEFEHLLLVSESFSTEFCWLFLTRKQVSSPYEFKSTQASNISQAKVVLSKKKINLGCKDAFLQANSLTSYFVGWFFSESGVSQISVSLYWLCLVKKIYIWFFKELNGLCKS